MIPTMEEARAILEPYHPLLRKIIEAGWDEWRRVQAFRSKEGMPSFLYTRVICNYVHGAIAHTGIPLIAVEDKLHLHIEPQTFKILFPGNPGLIARVKKGDDDHLGQNHVTQAVLDFVEADGFLPGTSRETGHVEIVWLPNEIWTDIDRILVVARDGNELVWEYDIDRREPSSKVVVFPAPAVDDREGGPSLVKPKTPAKPDTKRQ